jgi:hypothetical protein
MRNVTQFSVFMANKPGILAQISRAMAKEKINITALSMMDTADTGVLRLTADKPDAARAVLQNLNVPMTETEVLSVPVANRVGAVADLCERLSKHHVHISYLYATTGGRGAQTTVVLKVNDTRKAMRAISGPSKHVTGKDMKIKLRRPGGGKRR